MEKEFKWENKTILAKIIQRQTEALKVENHSETKITASGGGGEIYRGTGSIAPIKIKSQKKRHSRVWVSLPSGREQAIDIPYGFLIREGHTLSTWHISANEKILADDAIAFFCPNTQSTYFADLTGSALIDELKIPDELPPKTMWWENGSGFAKWLGIGAALPPLSPNLIFIESPLKYNLLALSLTEKLTYSATSFLFAFSLAIAIKSIAQKEKNNREQTIYNEMRYKIKEKRKEIRSWVKDSTFQMIAKKKNPKELNLAN